MNFDERQSDILMYQTDDGTTKIEVALDGETVWLSLNQMAELFQRDKSVISRHIKNVFQEGELDQHAVVAFFATTAADGKSYDVADGEAAFMGMTAFIGEKLKKSDAAVAKNYLKEDEIKILNRLVAAYLEFAELQAIRQNPMYMRDWVEKLDDFIKLSGSELLQHAGRISHEQARIKAELEYEKYKERTKDELTKAEKDFLNSIKETQKKLEEKKKC